MSGRDGEGYGPATPAHPATMIGRPAVSGDPVMASQVADMIAKALREDETARRARWREAFGQALATFTLGGTYSDSCVIPLMELSDDEFIERTAAMQEGRS